MPEGPGFRPNSRSESSKSAVFNYIEYLFQKIQFYEDLTDFIVQAKTAADTESQNPLHAPSSDAADHISDDIMATPTQMSFSESEIPRRRAASFRNASKENDLARLDEDAKEPNGKLVSVASRISPPIPIKYAHVETFSCFMT